MEQFINPNAIAVVLLFILFIFVYSQQKFKNKMLCYFIRPNKTRIKKWVPLYSTYVIFDRKKYGIGHYNVDPECITMEWFTGGVNKLFPVLVPTLEFKWDTPNPLNPKTFQSTWHTPEVRNAAWHGHQYQEFAKAIGNQTGMKRNKLLEMLPLITLGIVVIMAFIVWTGFANIGNQFAAMQQLINTKIH